MDRVSNPRVSGHWVIMEAVEYSPPFLLISGEHGLSELRWWQECDGMVVVLPLVGCQQMGEEVSQDMFLAGDVTEDEVVIL